ncbi:MAG: metal-dependent hydrolase [Deltaproteobacteria bacterium]|nr:metal-dependent hydrolase [Deltaproteobacteria bacterium]
MDTITHGLIGALASKAGFYQKPGRVATVAFTIGAVFPDVDFVTLFLGPDFALRYHRGITHSVIAAPFFAILLGAIIYRFSSFKNLRFLTLPVALGIYSHIFFDLITSYGTVVFDPLSMKRYSWNLVFILDPFITLPVLIGLILAWRKKEIAFKVSIIVLTFLSLYLLVCLYARDINSERLAEFAKKRSLDVIKSSVYPRPLAPFFWMGVIETEEAFYKGNLSIFNNGIYDYEVIQKTEGNSYIKLANKLDEVRLYRWFADFPVSLYKNEDGKHIVEFYDLRFRMISTKFPFLLKVVFDNNGRLENILLNGRKVEKRF